MISNNYLTWFKFLDGQGYENTVTNLKDMLITSCSFKDNETYDSLRKAKVSYIDLKLQNW